MLKTAAIAVAATALALFLINAASLFVSPSCTIEQIIPSSGNQNSQEKSSDELCPPPEGIIVAGIEQITHLFSPEAWTALATVIMAVFTGVLSVVAYQQIELSRVEFFLTHRPRLKVRRISIVGIHQHFPEAPLMPGEELNASLEMVNAGGSQGTITWSRYRIYFGKENYPLIAYRQHPPLSLPGGQITFEPGEPFVFELVDIIPKDIAQEGTLIRPNFGQDDWRMYVIGEVRYRDRIGTIRHIGFCRQMQGDRSFRAVNDPDYEYED